MTQPRQKTCFTLPVLLSVLADSSLRQLFSVLKGNWNVLHPKKHNLIYLSLALTQLHGASYDLNTTKYYSGHQAWRHTMPNLQSHMRLKVWSSKPHACTPLTLITNLSLKTQPINSSHQFILCYVNVTLAFERQPYTINSGLFGSRLSCCARSKSQQLPTF